MIDARKYFNFAPYRYWLSCKATKTEQPLEYIVEVFNAVFKRNESVGKCPKCSLAKYKTQLMRFREEYQRYLRNKGVSFEDEVTELVKGIETAEDKDEYIRANINGTATELDDEFKAEFLADKSEVTNEEKPRRTRRAKK